MPKKADEDELTPEERALLADAADSDTVSRARPPVEPKADAAEDKANQEKVEDKPEDKPEAAEEKVDAAGGPHAGHPLAPPAQMSYDDDPWGGLPVQMRHDADDNPVF